MAYAVFESTNMKSTFHSDIISVVAATDIENGTFGYADGLATGETEVYNFVKGTSAGKQVIVADNPAWDADTSKITNQRKDKYIIPAGTVFRARIVNFGDKFSISADGFTAATKADAAKDKFVTIDSTTGKLVVAATASNSSPVMEGVIESTRIAGATLVTTANNYGYSRTMYKVRVTTLA